MEYRSNLRSSEELKLLRSPYSLGDSELLYFDNTVGPEKKNYMVRSGDNLLGILVDRMELSSEDAYGYIGALKKIFDTNNLKIGQEISVRYKTAVEIGDEKIIHVKSNIDELRIYDRNNSMEFAVYREADGAYISKKHRVDTVTYYNRYFVNINKSLYSDAVAANVPAEIILDLINIYSFDIDFQRDIRNGDSLEIIFKSLSTENGSKTRSSGIVYANLNVGGVDHRIYGFNYNGRDEYFNKDGISTRKSLLKTPVDGARITSSYGSRRHPILGYTRAHRGIDFAVPVGTPFYAAGNGTVKKVVSNCRAGDRRCGNGYGNYLLIQHNNSYSSEYAHLLRVARNIKVGQRVRQGEVIGFVGNTGLSTGPHLHYGIIYNNERINPTKVKTIASLKLYGVHLNKFLQEKNKIDNFKLSAITSK
ncbi:MAG: M23 family metallopeptidase [Rickettsiales bacterium]|nr:M23 family metallopeptidase [Rickettsiales bacterium]